MGDTSSIRAALRRHVAPELLAGLDVFPALELTDEAIAQYRLPGRAPLMERPLTPEQAAVTREERFTSGLDGAPDVRFLVYIPRDGARLRPAYVHIHGGGFVLGTPEINDASNRDIAARHDAVVVSVDYRLAPETRFPGAVDDCLAVWLWLHAEAGALGVDPARIALGGESAGGGHAAALALRLVAVGGPPIRFLMLDAPMLDDRTGTQGDPREGVSWSAQHNRFGWRSLLGVEPGGPDVPAGAVPARAEDLSGLPPTLITVGAVDLFADEDIAFARRLILAGVPTELHVIPGAYHGFGIAGDTPQARMLDRYRHDALARALAAERPSTGDQA